MNNQMGIPMYVGAIPVQPSQNYAQKFDYTAAYRDDFYDQDEEYNNYEYEEGEITSGYENYDRQNNMGGNGDNGYSESVSSRERDRDRESRSRRRHYDNKRDEHRRRSKDRSRTRDRDRDRDYRDRDRGRDRRDRDRRRNQDERSDEDASDSRDSYERRDRDRQDRDDRAGEKWMTDTPTNTILLRGLPVVVEEKDIRAELMLCGLPIKDVRLMRKSTGASRGFAFVEFQTITDAARWMDQHQGQLMLQNQYTATMHYSTPKTGPEKGLIHKMDWTCSKCGVHNFKRRDHCFKCNLTREESERKQEGDGFDQVGTNPCNTLILRGLDALTTEENIIQALGQITSTPVKNCRVIRDDLTNTSRGYGFLEFNSVAESTQICEHLSQLKPPFEVDGKQIIVNYAKNTFSTVMATLKGPSSQSDYSHQHSYDGQYYQSGDYDQAQYGQYYDGQNYDYNQYYNQQYGTDSSQTAQGGTQTDTTNAAAAVALAAIQQRNAVKQYQKQVKEQRRLADMTPEQRLASQAEEWTKKGPAGTTVAPTTTTTTPAVVATTASSQDSSQAEYPVYPAPDVSQYQYDETSGYYYDPVTGLYYDANSQYYYNAQIGQFLYWDAEKSTYLPAPTNSDDSQGNGEKPKKEKDKKEKVKVAKKIAKDMEKWAKTLNAQKEAFKGMSSKITLAPGISRAAINEKESATADAGFTILAKSATGRLEDTKVMPPPTMQKAKAGPGTPLGPSALVASYGGDSDSDEGEGDNSGPVDESKLTDWDKLACLLCKRRFQTKEILVKHQQMSDLHKQNLESLYRSRGGGADGSEKLQYRDRAKERRDKYGVPPPPEPRNKRLEPEIIPEQPTRTGIQQDNIGNKMLQKMGWSAGQGLGKAGQGIVTPIEAKTRVQAAGLGMRGANYVTGTSDDYRENAKKAMLARYQETL